MIVVVDVEDDGDDDDDGDGFVCVQRKEEKRWATGTSRRRHPACAVPLSTQVKVSCESYEANTKFFKNLSMQIGRRNRMPAKITQTVKKDFRHLVRPRYFMIILPCLNLLR